MTEAARAKLIRRSGPRCHLSNNHVSVNGSGPLVIEVQRQKRKAIAEIIESVRSE